MTKIRTMFDALMISIGSKVDRDVTIDDLTAKEHLDLEAMAKLWETDGAIARRLEDYVTNAIAQRIKGETK